MILLFVLAPMGRAFAQETPQPSPKAKVEQRVGLTDVKIEYSSPGVKGREIFGGLVPYDEIWRTGANKATSISFSKPVTIQDQKVPAGSYSFFTIPGKRKWTLIFNENTELWGTNGYDREEDLFRIEVEAEEMEERRERMTFLVSDFDNNRGRIDLEWDQTRVSFVFETNTDKHAMENIEAKLSEVPRKYANSARYTLRAKKHYEKGLEWAKTSIQLEEGWYNTWIKASILMRMERFEKAKEAMERAKELGDQAENFFYEDKVKKQLKKIEKKVGG